MKLALVAAIWVLGPVLGPVIDNVVEPKFRKLAEGSGESASPEFTQSLGNYLMLEGVATGLFYVIIAMWALG